MGIENLLGIALGCIGLSLADFCVLTPDEWAEVYRNYREMLDEREKLEWERLRLLCAYTIQPHSRKKINPKKMMSFPWDNEKMESQNLVSREVGRDRFEKMKQKLEECNDVRTDDRGEGGT